MSTFNTILNVKHVGKAISVSIATPHDSAITSKSVGHCYDFLVDFYQALKTCAQEDKILDVLFAFQEKWGALYECLVWL